MASLYRGVVGESTSMDSISMGYTVLDSKSLLRFRLLLGQVVDQFARRSLVSRQLELDADVPTKALDLRLCTVESWQDKV